VKLKRLLVLISLLAYATPVARDDFDAAQAFANAYNAWAHVRSAQPMGAYSAAEPALWKNVQKAWGTLNRTVRY